MLRIIVDLECYLWEIPVYIADIRNYENYLKY